MNITKYTAISLYSGAGGMDVGMAAAGIEVVYANEINKHAANTYKANFGDHISCADIANELGSIKRLVSVDFVFGGPPCQAFSVAGKMDPSDPRAQHVYRFMDVVAIAKPKVFIMENVKALAKLEKFAGVREELHKRARSLGYAVDMTVLNAKDFGVPQARERMFFVGVLDGCHFSLESTAKRYSKPEVSVGDAIRALGRQGSDANPKTCNATVTLAANPVLRKSPYAGMIFNGLGRPIDPKKPAPTLPASMGGNKTPIVDEEQLFDLQEGWVEKYHSELMRGEKPQDWKSAPNFLRRLTIAEAKILHSFPSDFVFVGPKSAIYTQIGNAVPCKLAEVVARSMIDVLMNRASSGKIHETLPLNL